MNKRTMITAHNLSVGYAKKGKEDVSFLYRDLSLELYVGELTCLLGVNGSGKSTLLRTITGLQPPLGGCVEMDGRDIRSYSEADLSTKIGLVLTEKTSVGGLTVEELVALGRYPYTGFWGKLSTKDKDIVWQAMEDVCIIHKANTYVAELSDGERQKAMIAKALAQECPIIILDEPTAFLDVVNRIEVMSLLHHLSVRQHKAILLSTHDIELAFLLADRLWLLEKEKGFVCGTTEDIILSDVIDDYLGRGNITFSKKTGKFYAKTIENGTEVSLKADGELFYWAKNFLVRNGYRVTDRFVDGTIFVEVDSQDRIIVKKGEQHQLLCSFEELTDYMNKIND